MNTRHTNFDVIGEGAHADEDCDLCGEPLMFCMCDDELDEDGYLDALDFADSYDFDEEDEDEEYDQ